MIKIICDICGEPYRESNNVKYIIIREFNDRREESQPLDLCGKCMDKLYNIVMKGKPSF